MDNNSEQENLKNQFEIEERVLQALTDKEEIKYFNKIRTTRVDLFNKEERLKSTNKREIYWNKLATSFLNKYFQLT